MEYLLGIDVGTTSLKAGLFAPDGRCLGVERQEYQLDTPSAECAQLDAQRYWQACVQTVRKLLLPLDNKAKSIVAVAISSQGETTIALDADGNPVYPALVWLDNRASSQANSLAKQFKDQVYEHTGIAEIIPTWSACKVLWIKENEPQAFSRVAKFLLVQDYLVYKMTGRYVTDGSVSCTNLFFDIIRNSWWPEMLEAVGIQAEQLPEIAMPGSVAGIIRKEAARELGLPDHVKVVNSGMDQAVGAIGAGNINPGVVSETTGAALAIQVTVKDPFIDPHKSIPVYVHSVPDHYLLVPVCPTAGMAFKWFRDQFGDAEIKRAESENLDSYDLMTELASSVQPGADGLVMLPHLMGAFSPEINPLARGSFTGFTLSHTRAHFVRALLEGVAFLLKRNIEFVEGAGIQVSEIVSTGGGSRSRLWNQIKANVCNTKIITLQNEETALLGNAILAGVACGLFKTVADGCRVMVAAHEKFVPDREAQAYILPYQKYCELDRVLSEYYSRVYDGRKNTTE